MCRPRQRPAAGADRRRAHSPSSPFAVSAALSARWRADRRRAHSPSSPPLQKSPPGAIPRSTPRDRAAGATGSGAQGPAAQPSSSSPHSPSPRSRHGTRRIFDIRALRAQEGAAPAGRRASGARAAAWGPRGAAQPADIAESVRKDAASGGVGAARGRAGRAPKTIAARCAPVRREEGRAKRLEGASAGAAAVAQTATLAGTGAGAWASAACLAPRAAAISEAEHPAPTPHPKRSPR